MDGEKLFRRVQALESDAGQWLTVWQDISDWVMPRKSQILDLKTPDVEGYTDEIYDTEAIHSNITLAAGQLDYMVSGKWFDFEDPNNTKDREVEAWYKKAAEITLAALQASNFNLEIHEFFIDRGGFGTAHIHCDEDDDDGICFKNFPVGSFFITENHKGMVDGVYHKRQFTHRQAVQKFGEENVPDDVRKGAEKPESESQKHDYWHCVFKRDHEDIEHGKEDGQNKPWASVWLHAKARKVCLEGGYNSQPFAVSRYLKWGSEIYGYCPSIEVLPTIRQVNFIEKQLDAQHELATNPRMLVPDSMEGEVDYRAGGVTVFDANNPQAIPREWASGGRFDVGLDRAKQKRDLIQRAYHVDLFQMLTQFDEMRREKTAFEVSQMMAEKITRISPTFERIKNEVFKPVLDRVFQILFDAGKFDDPPEGVLFQRPDGEIVVKTPKVQYTSKLSMAIKALENQNIIALMQMVMPLAEVAPDALQDEFNFKRMLRKLGMNQSVPADVWNTAQEQEEIQQARAQQRQAEMAMQMAQTGAKAARDMGSAPQAAQDAVGRALGINER